MKISKKDALMWFRFFAALPEEGRIAVLRRESAFGRICERAFLLKKRLGPFEGLR